MLIDPEGVPQETNCLKGPRELRSHAGAYALKWRFQPAMLNGQAMWAKFILKMPFKLTPL